MLSLHSSGLFLLTVKEYLLPSAILGWHAGCRAIGPVPAVSRALIGAKACQERYERMLAADGSPMDSSDLRQFFFGHS